MEIKKAERRQVNSHYDSHGITRINENFLFISLYRDNVLSDKKKN
jgi:hypothetical protein